MYYAHKLRTLLKNSNNYQRSLTDQYSCAPVSSGFFCVCVAACVCVCVCVCVFTHMCVHLCGCLHDGLKVTTPLPRTSWLWSVLPHWKSPTHLRGLLSLQVGLPGSERLLSETGNHHHLHRALRFLRFGQCDQEEATIRHLQSPSHNLTLNSCINGPDAHIQHNHSMLGHFTMGGDEGHAAQRAPSLNISESWKFRFTKPQPALGQGHPTL